MQLFPLLLVAIVLAVDGGLRPVGEQWGIGAAGVTAIALAPIFAIVLLAAVGVSYCGRQLARGRLPGPLIAADRMVRWARWLIIANHALAVMVFGWLGAVRSVTGNLIFIDEFLAIAPALLGLIGTYWAYYPIEQRMRDALLIRRLDDGLPIYPAPSRAQYVMLQMRLHLLLLLVPVLLIVLLAEAIEKSAAMYADPAWASGLRSGGGLAAAAGVFILSPLLARILLDVQPLAAGPLRESLLEVCRRHRVKIRQLLLWNTHGSVINAAVMGLIGRLRYVMITDALLESMPHEQVRAVMAHEIGHVRRRHLPWMVVCLLASFVIAWQLMEWPVHGVRALGWIKSQGAANAAGAISSGGQLILGLVVFGWISRRFERQADTFAVQHLSETGSNQPIITSEAVGAMCSALDSIATLNNVDRHRPSWRHGSIAWRQQYLASLVGRQLKRLPIDRLVPVLKIASAVVLAIGIAQEIMRQ